VTAVAVRVPPPSTPDRLAAELAARCFGERYEVIRPLGRGGMGQVWLAWDRVVGRDVALKILEAALARSLEHRERFRREALIAARFPHPHVVQCYELHCDRTAAVAVMRYVRGDTLADRLRNGRRLPPDLACRILIPIVDAVAHLHRHGVVHRDLKPENILLQGEDEGGRPFLTDFGIATLRTSEQSRAEVVRRYGTPDFMAPEQLAGEWDADHRSDIYALGLVAFSALTGRLPFAGGNLALAAQRLAFDASPSVREFAPDVSPTLACVIDRCLARNPRRRWPDALGLRDALARAADGEHTLWRRVRTWMALRRS
jgi:serine/threonine-protein kinase